MISYSWDVHPERVDSLYQKLVAKGIKTWYDKKDMKPEELNQQMAEVIEGAALIVICASRKYVESKWCKKEAEYMDGLRKPVIYLKIDKELPEKGWFRLLMGSNLYIDISGDAKVEESLDRVVDAVQQRLGVLERLQTDAPLARTPLIPAPHSAIFIGSDPPREPQMERKAQFENWTIEEVTLWLKQEDISYYFSSS